jgi:hypothetical protein
MSFKSLTTNQRMGRMHAVPKAKKHKSDAALIFALMIGVFASLGIIVLANSEPGDIGANPPASVQVDGQR